MWFGGNRHGNYLLPILLLIICSPQVLASKDAQLPKGICPFDPKLIHKNFTKALRRDYGKEGIEIPFMRREKWYGACEGATRSGKNRFLLRYKQAEIPLLVEWKKKQVEQFQFGDVKHRNDSWDEFSAFLRKYWPDSSFYVRLPGAESEVGYRAQDYLNIGEGRTLLLIRAVEEKIKEGALGNLTALELREADKVQDIDDLAEEPAGSKHTISDLKDRVFNRFDRTAADLILRAVGATSIEGGREEAAPFLSRREFAWLMTLPKDKMAALQREEARLIAGRMDQPAEMPPLPMERYDHLGKIEWKGSARELCEALLAIASVPELYEGLASRNFRAAHPAWKSGVYYAARDFGLAQTTWSASLPGYPGPVCFSLVLNEADFLDEEAVEEIHARAIGILSKAKKPQEVKGKRPLGR